MITNFNLLNWNLKEKVTNKAPENMSENNFWKDDKNKLHLKELKYMWQCLKREVSYLVFQGI